jgi:hypothetical protein
MGLAGPKLQQQRPFEQEFVAVRRPAQTVKESLQSLPDQQQLNFLCPLTGEVQESLTD